MCVLKELVVHRRGVPRPPPGEPSEEPSLQPFRRRPYQRGEADASGAEPDGQDLDEDKKQIAEKAEVRAEHEDEQRGDRERDRAEPVYGRNYPPDRRDLEKSCPQRSPKQDFPSVRPVNRRQGKDESRHGEDGDAVRGQRRAPERHPEEQRRVPAQPLLDKN